MCAFFTHPYFRLQQMVSGNNRGFMGKSERKTGTPGAGHVRFVHPFEFAKTSISDKTLCLSSFINLARHLHIYKLSAKFIEKMFSEPFHMRREGLNQISCVRHSNIHTRRYCMFTGLSLSKPYSLSCQYTCQVTQKYLH